MPVFIIAACALVGIVGILVVSSIVRGQAEREAAEKAAAAQAETSVDQQELSRAKQMVADLTLEEKVAQLFIVRPEALTNVEAATEAGTTTRDAISKNPVCGLLYDEKNFVDAKQVSGLLKSTQNYVKDASGLPALMCIQEEGGSQAPLATSFIEPNGVSNAARIGASNEEEEAREAARHVGEYVSKYGFNLDMAPVADIVSSADSDLSERSFGDTPEKVATMVAAQVDGYERAGILCAVKHFPGIGEAEPDPHNERRYSHRSAEEMKKRELIPFKAAIDAHVPIVIVSNMSCLGVGNGEGDVPSWMSKAVVTDMLRGDMHFEGVVMTDMLDAKSVEEACDPSEQAVRALKAGTDIMVCPMDYERAYRGVLDAVENGELKESDIDEAVTRIVMLKQSLKE